MEKMKTVDECEMAERNLHLQNREIEQKFREKQLQNAIIIDVCETARRNIECILKVADSKSIRWSSEDKEEFAKNIKAILNSAMMEEVKKMQFKI